MQSDPQTHAAAKEWQKTSYANLIRYVPSRTYFARVRVAGKLIRRSLKTDVLTVAKLRLADLEKAERHAAKTQERTSQGRMTFAAALDLLRQQVGTTTLLKPSTKRYQSEIAAALIKSWPGLEQRAVQEISDLECKTWAAKFSGSYSPTRYNAAVGLLRSVFATAIEAGASYRNPATAIKRASVRVKVPNLPGTDQFERFLAEVENGGGGKSRECAEMVRFLAYGGFRISEARNITWADCNFDKGEIVVRGDPETGTKNWSIRRVPMIADMRDFLETARAARSGEPPEAPILRVSECPDAMNRAAKVVGMPRLTHHDLRHLFATRCIESGVDIPTVARWLGHKDGGALAMRTYGHLRDEHSVNMARKVSFSKHGSSTASS